MQPVNQISTQILFFHSRCLPKHTPHIHKRNVKLSRHFAHRVCIRSRGFKLTIQCHRRDPRLQSRSALKRVDRWGCDEDDPRGGRIAWGCRRFDLRDEVSEVLREPRQGNVLWRWTDTGVVGAEPDGEHPDFGDVRVRSWRYDLQRMSFAILTIMIPLCTYKEYKSHLIKHRRCPFGIISRVTTVQHVQLSCIHVCTGVSYVLASITRDLRESRCPKPFMPGSQAPCVIESPKHIKTSCIYAAIAVPVFRPSGSRASTESEIRSFSMISVHVTRPARHPEQDFESKMPFAYLP